MSEAKEPRTTALVVDDEPMMVRLCSSVLHSMDIDVLEAHSPAQALAILDADAGGIRLLLTDIRMGPGMDGVELSHHAKKTWPHLDIIIMSGFAEEESVKRMLAGSGIPFLPKPFSITAFREAVLATLNAAANNVGRFDRLAGTGRRAPGLRNRAQLLSGEAHGIQRPA